MTAKTRNHDKTPAKGKPTPEVRGDQLLRELGARVREARARRGMTRRILADDSGVSERYLAQLEAGEGNISVLRLHQIASALNEPVSDLLREDNQKAVELTLIEQFLKRLPAHRLIEVRSQLIRDFGNARNNRMHRIALIGLRGAGKSTLGARLARMLDYSFLELDHEVEREAGTSLNEIFLLYGQAGYRRYERRCLENIVEQNANVVIATGGSIVSEASTYDILLSTCLTVWLRAQPEEHMARVVAQGDTRPMAGNQESMDDLRRILTGRAALYGQADVVVDTAGKTVEQSLAELSKAIGAEKILRRAS
ncbi:MAG: helix-turn-helix transcriptional regulator [Betaproteobacteria bacterium]|nr:helix-turn-helix transcriptional regulator [Betaproteobacteria bacterium]